MSKFAGSPRDFTGIAGPEASWDGRRLWRDLWNGLVACGERLGASRASLRAFAFGFAAVATFVIAVNAMNIITLLHDGRTEAFAEPIVRESSSGVTFLAFVWIPWLACRLAPVALRPRVGATHAIAAVLFSVCHVGSFVALRTLVYGLAGWRYGFHLSEFPYELRKDVIAYGLVVAIFSAATAFVRNENRRAPDGNRLFDVRDGARLVRICLDDVLTIASAGNYAEFSLCDGRRILTRKALSALERELASRGFIRTHRSWIVNQRAVTGLKPEGSGDFTIGLGSSSAPLSRRFPEALAKLRGQ